MEEKCILDPQKDCLGLMKGHLLEKDIEEIRRDVDDIRERNNKSHSEFYDRLAVLEKHNEVQDVRYEHIIEKLADITNKLNGLVEKIAAIEGKPGKKWENLVGQIIGLVVTAVVLFVLSKLEL